MNSILNGQALRGDGLTPNEVQSAEAFHRIANGLQLVASLVRLQGCEIAKRKEMIDGQEVRSILQDTAARIGAVATLNRLLSRIPRGADIDLLGYLREICQSISDATSFDGTLTVTDRGSGVSPVSADVASTLAVLVSELVTNAIKHAHPAGVRGTIDVACERVGDGIMMVEVSDDGVGFPEGYDPARDAGLGLTVIHALTRQLGASLEFESGDLGLTARLRFAARGGAAAEAGSMSCDRFGTT